MKKILYLIVLLFIVGLSSCSTGNNPVDAGAYRIDYYIDTISGHTILNTVCYGSHTGNLSISTIELK